MWLRPVPGVFNLHSSFIFFVEVKIILSAPRNIMRGKFNDFFLDTKTRWAQDVVSDCEAITLVHVGAKYISWPG